MTGNPPAGWYDDDDDGPVLRYWDGSAWTTHTAPREAPPPQAAATATCPYCRSAMHPQATRCPSCGGELRYCPRDKALVAVWSKKKFVGLARGGTQTQLRCAKCNKVLDGPRF
jgi:hypothetical protein